MQHLAKWQSIVTLKVTYAECHMKTIYVECHYAECHGTNLKTVYYTYKI